MSGKLVPFTPILWLKDEAEFAWGAKQQVAFDQIKHYLSTPPVLRTPKSGESFWLYIAAQEDVIGAILTQEFEAKEHIITYVSRILLDAETRYSFIEKLCFLLYYACAKLRHYLLASTCIVACQTDVIKHILHRPILRGRLGKWAYALIEYDLVFESLKTMKEKVVADFIVEHRVDVEHDDCLYLDTNFISCTSWKLYCDGSACSSGQGIGIVIVSPNGDDFEAYNQLNYFCTNNQAKYEALLFGLEILASMKVRHVKAFGDSLLVVQQVSNECQCLEGSLNAYLDKCLDVIKFSFDEFCIHHISRHENCRANDLAKGGIWL
jgi:ribonuclease HI